MCITHAPHPFTHRPLHTNYPNENIIILVHMACSCVHHPVCVDIMFHESRAAGSTCCCCCRTRLTAAVTLCLLLSRRRHGCCCFLTRLHIVVSTYCSSTWYTYDASLLHDPQTKQESVKPAAYFSFFLGRSWLVRPHFFLRQFLARGCRRA